MKIIREIKNYRRMIRFIRMCRLNGGIGFTILTTDRKIQIISMDSDLGRSTLNIKQDLPGPLEISKNRTT